MVSRSSRARAARIPNESEHYAGRIFDLPVRPSQPQPAADAPRPWPSTRLRIAFLELPQRYRYRRCPYLEYGRPRSRPEHLASVYEIPSLGQIRQNPSRAPRVRIPFPAPASPPRAGRRRAFSAHDNRWSAVGRGPSDLTVVPLSTGRGAAPRSMGQNLCRRYYGRSSFRRRAEILIRVKGGKTAPGSRTCRRPPVTAIRVLKWYGHERSILRFVFLHSLMNSRERAVGEPRTRCEFRPQGWSSPCASINATASGIFA